MMKTYESMEYFSCLLSFINIPSIYLGPWYKEHDFWLGMWLAYCIVVAYVLWLIT